MSVCRRAIAIVLLGCLHSAALQAQTPDVELSPLSHVITDSKGVPKSICLEFQITTSDVVERVSLLYRQSGKPKYSEQELKLNPQLLYEASIPYSETTEYYFAVAPERGTSFSIGSGANPRVLQSETLHSEPEIRRTRLKKAAIVGVTIVVAVLAAVIGAERLAKSKR
jgi:hypothetical protein